ncbi:DNA-binding MarR family transcriptional regulator [Microbacterium resistens]|uniref:DNA-binding MarR family transcriptional regulator n=1 Tax=Microbacterium resistens TaxID=156977 RepID=A0ABU1SEK2_9MICO|nr:MarR family transcriptional regulator [Microbacterium resistens]MDR6868045.1 DNA-binding MarR family transcriptional regulator [Microbacterium resistens]
MDAARRPARTGFLLSQLGAFASARFGELIRPAGLTPSTAGVLRIIARQPGLSQRKLADRLGAVPSRVVVLVDSLEGAGLVERSRDPEDRRHHRLDLTERGRQVLGELRGAAETQNADVLAPLDPEEREVFAALVSKLAAAHGLDPDVHRGYGDAPSPPSAPSAPSPPR